MKIVKKILIGLLIILFTLQLYQPERNNTKGNHTEVFLAETNPPEDVRLILKSTCYDCHSNQTTYPWYAYIAPVSYWMNDHIRHGKGELNFSDWQNYSKKKKDHKLEEVMEEVQADKMPIENYTWMHANAQLNKEQKESIAAWVQKTRVLYQLGRQPE